MSRTIEHPLTGETMQVPGRALSLAPYLNAQMRATHWRQIAEQHLIEMERWRMATAVTSVMLVLMLLNILPDLWS